MVSNSAINPFIFLLFNSSSSKATAIARNCCPNSWSSHQRFAFSVLKLHPKQSKTMALLNLVAHNRTHIEEAIFLAARGILCANHHSESQTCLCCWRLSFTFLYKPLDSLKGVYARGKISQSILFRQALWEPLPQSLSEFLHRLAGKIYSHKACWNFCTGCAKCKNFGRM